MFVPFSLRPAHGRPKAAVAIPDAPIARRQ